MEFDGDDCEFFETREKMFYITFINSKVAITSPGFPITNTRTVVY